MGLSLLNNTPTFINSSWTTPMLLPLNPLIECPSQHSFNFANPNYDFSNFKLCNTFRKLTSQSTFGSTYTFFDKQFKLDFTGSETSCRVSLLNLPTTSCSLSIDSQSITFDSHSYRIVLHQINSKNFNIVSTNLSDGRELITECNLEEGSGECIFTPSGLSKYSIGTFRLEYRKESSDSYHFKIIKRSFLHPYLAPFFSFMNETSETVMASFKLQKTSNGIAISVIDDKTNELVYFKLWKNSNDLALKLGNATDELDVTAKWKLDDEGIDVNAKTYHTNRRTASVTELAFFKLQKNSNDLALKLGNATDELDVTANWKLYDEEIDAHAITYHTNRRTASVNEIVNAQLHFKDQNDQKEFFMTLRTPFGSSTESLVITT